MEGTAILGPEGGGGGVGKVDRRGPAQHPPQSPHLRGGEIRFVEGCGLQGYQPLDETGIDPFLLGIDGDVAPLLQDLGTVAGAEQGRGPILPGNGGKMAGGTADVGDNGRRFADHGAQLRTGITADGNPAHRKIRRIAVRFHMHHRPGADPQLGNMPITVHEQDGLPQLGGNTARLRRRPGRQIQPAALQNHQSPFAVTAPLDILGPVKGLFEQHPGFRQLRKTCPLHRRRAPAQTVGSDLHWVNAAASAELAAHRRKGMLPGKMIAVAVGPAGDQLLPGPTDGGDGQQAPDPGRRWYQGCR